MSIQTVIQGGWLTKRALLIFLTVFAVVCVVTLIHTQKSSANEVINALQDRLTKQISNKTPNQLPKQEPLNTGLKSAVAKPSITYRYNTGLVTVYNKMPDNLNSNLNALSISQLHNLYEKTALNINADCTTSRRLGRREDGGWDLCLVGPFIIRSPCFSFSFGVNEIWEFDDEVAKTFKCQVAAFDPSVRRESYWRSERLVFLKEGLHSAPGTIGSGWKVDSYLGFLKRFGADKFVVDILKIDIEGSEWPAFETAVTDGSLKNVKQLMFETHANQGDSKEKYIKYLGIFRSLFDLGFRQWHHNWNLFGNFRNSITGDDRTCCHELYYININFLASSKSATNSPGAAFINPIGNKLRTAG